MSCGKWDSIHAVMDFTEVLKNEPEKAFDFITFKDALHQGFWGSSTKL